MTDKLSMHVVTRAQIRDPEYWKSWTWPIEVQPIGGRYRDFLLHHPLANDDKDPVQILAKTGSQVVGSVNLINGNIQVDSKDVDVLWAGGLVVPEKFRHTGAGLMLILQMTSVHHTICAVGVSQIVAPIYEKLRWVTFPMPRYLLLRRSRSVLNSLVGRGIACVTAPVVDSILAAQSALLQGWTKIRGCGFVVERSDALPKDFDTQLAVPRATVTCHRSSTWINWLLSHRKETRQLHTVRDNSGRALGYFICTSSFHESASGGQFKNLTLGSIKEWMVLDPQNISDIELVLLATCELCGDDRLDAIEVCLPNEVLGASLQRMGFVRKGELRLLYKASTKSPLANQKYRNRSDWWFRPADGDHFFF